MDNPPIQVARISWEQRAIAELRDAIGKRVQIAPLSGMGGMNRKAPAEWNLTPKQQFQFGDLRYENRSTRVVVEVESAGGLTNLVKYWPMIPADLSDKRFFLAHLFQLNSKADYIAHRRLWTFVVDQMRADLANRDFPWGDRWEAQMFTYGHATAATGMGQAADYVASKLSMP